MEHSFNSAVNALERKNVIFIHSSPRNIMLNFIVTKEGRSKIRRENTKLGIPRTIHLNSAFNLGNGSWGKIDYLIKIHNYKISGRHVYLKRQELN